MTNDLNPEIAKTGVNGNVVAPHAQRMLDEQAELADRHTKLGAFFSNDLFAKLDAVDQQLLHEQHEHMGAYLTVLNARIERAQA